VLRSAWPQYDIPPSTPEDFDRSDPTYGIDFGEVRKTLRLRSSKKRRSVKKGGIEGADQKPAVSSVVKRVVNPKHKKR